MKKFYLIRHARQNSKLCNVNVKLSVEGNQQAKLLGNRLKDYGIQRLYCSELLRAVETADIIGEQIGLIPIVLKDIHEIHFGELTGKTDEEIEYYYSDFKKKRFLMEEDIAFPGGENGSDVLKRVLPVMENILSGEESNIAIVTHGGVIRSLITYFLGLEQKNKLCFSKNLENTSITEIDFDEKRKRYYLERLNDYAHLENHPELLRKCWKGSTISNWYHKK